MISSEHHCCAGGGVSGIRAATCRLMNKWCFDTTVCVCVLRFGSNHKYMQIWGQNRACEKWWCIWWGWCCEAWLESWQLPVCVCVFVWPPTTWAIWTSCSWLASSPQNPMFWFVLINLLVDKMENKTQVIAFCRILLLTSVSSRHQHKNNLSNSWNKRAVRRQFKHRAARDAFRLSNLKHISFIPHVHLGKSHRKVWGSLKLKLSFLYTTFKSPIRFRLHPWSQLVTSRLPIGAERRHMPRTL